MIRLMAEHVLERVRREIHEHTQTAERRPRRQRAAQGRNRTRRGANREAILAAVGERPGATARELADATGIARTTVASTLTRLAAAGVLERLELPDGGVGFRARVAASAD